MTAQQLINLILKDLGETDGDETPTSNESDDALATLNHIIASWSNKGLLVATRAHTTFSLTSGTSVYLMGSGQTWATSARPMKIEGARAYMGKFENGVECLPYDQFRLKTRNATGIQSTLPEMLGFDNAVANVTVSLFPTPNDSTASIIIDYWIPLTAIASLATSVSFPEGFEWALRTAAVVALAPMYGREATATMLKNANDAMANLAEINASLRPAPQAA